MPDEPVSTTSEGRSKFQLPVGAKLREAVLREDDFGHEMRVRQVLESAQGKPIIEHGGLYRDPVEEKSRQFDLRCVFSCAGQGYSQIYLAVECKNLDPDRPFLISGTARADSESFHDLIISSVKNQPIVQGASVGKSVYRSGKFVGKSCVRFAPSTEGFKRLGGQEGDFSARWMQAISSAHELCQRAASAAQYDYQPVKSVIIPMLVVPDDSLWSVGYDHSGNLESDPMLTDEVCFYLNQRIAVYPNFVGLRLSHLHFFTLRGLSKFLNDFHDDSPIWNAWFPKH
jgi:hypothetical protein